MFVDYGHRGDRKTTSLRAYQNHQLVDPLSAPGAIDLTADVDFGYWQRILKGLCLTFGPIEQRHVLEIASNPKSFVDTSLHKWALDFELSDCCNRHLTWSNASKF